MLGALGEQAGQFGLLTDATSGRYVDQDDRCASRYGQVRGDVRLRAGSPGPAVAEGFPSGGGFLAPEACLSSRPVATDLVDGATGAAGGAISGGSLRLGALHRD